MKLNKKLFKATLLLLMTSSFLMSHSHLASARNGFIPHYVGLEGLLSGAGTAFPLDAIGVITNPAFLGKLPSHLIVMSGYFHQDQYVDTSQAPSPLRNPAAPRQKNQYTNIPLIDFGFNYRFNEHWAAGIGATGGGGFVKFPKAVTYPGSFGNPNYDTETVNRVILTSPTISYSPNPNQSYGLALLVSSSEFWSNIALGQGQQTQGQLASSKVYGVGTRIGGLWKINDRLTIGSSAATPVYFQPHKKYSDLFPAPMQIPATFRFGVAITLMPNLNLMLDYKELFYGAAGWVHRGQGWKNQSIYLMGLHYKWTENLSIGVGYNYAAVPFDSKNVLLNTTSIPLDEHHFSGGFTYQFTPGMEFIFMAYYVPKKSITDTTGSGPAGMFAKGMKLESSSYGGEIGLKWTF